MRNTQTHDKLELSGLLSGPVKLGTNYLTIESGATDVQLNDAFATLTSFESASAWYLGDFLNAVEAKHGEKFSKALVETGYELQTLKHIKGTCRNFPTAERRAVSFSHHKEAWAIAKDLKRATQFLDIAEAEKLTVAKMRFSMRLADRIAKGAPAPDAPLQYDRAFAGLLDAFATVRRYIEQTDSQTLALKRLHIKGELEMLLDMLAATAPETQEKSSLSGLSV